jgi:hypothetical protein
MLLAAVAIAGCGGASEKSPHDAAAARSFGAPANAGARAPRAHAATPGRNTGHPSSKHRKDTRHGSTGTEKGKRPRKLSPRQRRDATVRVSASILAQFGLPVSSIAVSRAADSLTVAIAKSGACTATRADEPRIKLVLGKLLPRVKTISITVGRSGPSLSDYVAANCKPRTVPGGPGRVLFHKDGAGFVKTDTIEITAKRWTIAYDSRASALRVSVYKKGGKRAVGTLSARGRRTGEKTFEGPGTFVLRIASPATWTIEVRDGA